jgi:hypothetical protein
MHRNKGHDPFELLSQFIRLRQNGVNRDEAWFQILRSLEEELHDATKQVFLNLAKNWERREGHKYHYRNSGNLYDTSTQHKEIEQQQTAAPSEHKEAARVEHNLMTGTLDPARLRQYQQRGLEQILNQVDAAPIEAPTPPEQVRNPDHFGPEILLLMYFMGYPKPLIVDIKGETELYIGRVTPNSAMAPEIDLTVVNGGDYGVSRMHAAITRRENRLWMVDLNSLNYTRVNGVRLLPDEIKTLQNGDDVWFGQLRCKLRFKQRC